MPKRVDKPQRAITETLRDLGCLVAITSDLGHGFTDLVVAIGKKLLLVEIKDGSQPPSRRKLTPDEAKFHSTWKDHVVILESIGDAIDLVNRIRSGKKDN